MPLTRIASIKCLGDFNRAFGILLYPHAQTIVLERFCAARLDAVAAHKIGRKGPVFLCLKHMDPALASASCTEIRFRSLPTAQQDMNLPWQ